MEKKWTITGAFTDWTLTVSTEPSEEYHLNQLPAWHLQTFGQLADHFYDIVNLCELLQDHDEGEGLAKALAWHGPERSTKGALGDGGAQACVQVSQPGPVGPDLDHA